MKETLKINNNLLKLDNHKLIIKIIYIYIILHFQNSMLKIYRISLLKRVLRQIFPMLLTWKQNLEKGL